MRTGTVARIETGVDRGAAILFALASGYAAHLWFSATAYPPLAAAEAAAVALLAFVLSYCTLSAVEPKSPKLPVPDFDVPDVEEGELLLTERFEPLAENQPEELLLDDILSELEPDSRVVRLFDPAAMPTAGELKSRIDRHLDGEGSAARNAEAAKALHEALAELRARSVSRRRSSVLR